MALFKPVEGAQYNRDELVALCEAYIHSPEFSGNVSEKEQKISLIRAKKTPVIEFRTRGKGWGNSSLNPNCWVEVGEAAGKREPTPSLEPQSSASMSSSNSPSRDVSRSKYNQRPWQGKYRGELLRLWGACAVTGCQKPELLTASHLKPVIYCTPEEMVDPFNGILLSKMYDKLLDSGLITFEDDGSIVFSSHVPQSDLLALGLKPENEITLDSRHLPYLEFHRSKIFKGNPYSHKSVKK